jgi:hypothetical protein
LADILEELTASIIVTPMMKAVCSSETSVTINKATQYNPEEGYLHV